MNYEQANTVKDLALPVNRVLEGLEVGQCSDCGGSGFEKEGEPLHEIQKDMDRDRPMELCDECNGTGKVKWKWEPKVGEWCIWKGNIEHIVDIDILSNDDFTLYFDYISDLDCYFDFDNRRVLASKVIPILGWEEIERVLEKAGYECDTTQSPFPKCSIAKMNVQRNIIYGPSKHLFTKQAKSRQEAVMKAVIELGKEIKE